MLRSLSRGLALPALLVPLAIAFTACKDSTDPASWNLDGTRWEGEIATSSGTDKVVLVFERAAQSPERENPFTRNVVPYYFVDFYRHIGTFPNEQTIFNIDAAYHEGADIYHPYYSRVGWQARLNTKTEMRIWDGDGAWEGTINRTN